MIEREPSNRSPDFHADGAWPSVTVVVSTYNRRTALERLLRSLDAMRSAATRLEVVVTVDGCTDATRDLLDSISLGYPLRVIDVTPNEGPARGRNRALAQARGDVILFLDDDVLPLPGLVERHLAVHRSDSNAVVIGPMLPPSDGGMPAWLRWEAVTLKKQYDAIARGDYQPTPRQFYTANASVRRVHALAVGGFDETFKRAEDVEFAYRLADHQLRFSFLPEAAVIHDPQRTWQGWLEMAYQYGRHAVIFERDRGRNQLQLAYQEWRHRHPLNRLLARACVGHPMRWKALGWICRVAFRRHRGRRWERLLMGLCSAAFSTRYWQGVADETELGTKVWLRPLAASALPHATSRLKNHKLGLRDDERQRILVVARGHLGDLVQAFPALRDLRNAQPLARITVLLNEYVAAAFEGCPYVDEVVPGFTYGRRNLVGTAAHVARLLSLVAGRYDAVIGLRWSPNLTPIMALLAGARVRAGFDRTGRLGRLLTHNLGAEPIDTVSNRVLNQLPLAALGVPVDSTYPQIDWLPERVVHETSDMLALNGLGPGRPFAVFQLSSHWGCAEWRSDKWAALGDYLADRHSLSVAVTGTSEWFEQAKFEQVKKLSRGRAPVSLLGKTSVPLLFEVVRRARLVVAGDSGLAQVALAQRTPSVILFGIEEIEANGPLSAETGRLMRPIQHWDKSSRTPPANPHCRFGETQCHSTFCREDDSRRRITVAEVCEQVDLLLRQSVPAAQRA